MSDEEAGETMEVCGIYGDADSPLTVGKFNRFITQLRWYHKRPIEHKLSAISEGLKATDKKIEGHIDYHKSIEDKLDGARRALYLVGGAAIFVAPIVYKFLDIIWPLIKK